MTWAVKGKEYEGLKEQWMGMRNQREMEHSEDFSYLHQNDSFFGIQENTPSFIASKMVAMTYKNKMDRKHWAPEEAV